MGLLPPGFDVLEKKDSFAVSFPVKLILYVGTVLVLKQIYIPLIPYTMIYDVVHDI